MEKTSHRFIDKYKLFTLLLLFVSITKVNAQSDILSDYRTIIEKRLHPVEMDKSAVEILFFMARPYFGDPEYSFSIVEINSLFYIRARILKKNLWQELSQLREKNQRLIPVHTPVFTKLISTSFKDSVLGAFRKSISSFRKRELPEGVVCMYDGPVFEFKVFSENDVDYIVVDDDINNYKYELKLTTLLERVVRDLKNGLFDESKYRFGF